MMGRGRRIWTRKWEAIVRMRPIDKCAALLAFFGVGTFPCRNITADRFQSRKPVHKCSAVIQISYSASYNVGSGLGGNPLGGRVALGVVVANCSGDHFRRTRTWRHSSEALNRLLRGSFGFVSIGFQGNAGLNGAAVAALKNKPAPDNPAPAWIFSEPIAIIAPLTCHRPNIPWHSVISGRDVDTLFCKNITAGKSLYQFCRKGMWHVAPDL